MPDMTGIDVCREVRTTAPTPIIILSVVGEERRKVEALDAGADDYLTKPFKFDELLARVRALVRRGGSGRSELLSYGPIELDRLKHRARIAGQKLDLTPKEFQLLEHFMLRPEEVVRRTDLLEKVWDLHFDPESNVVDVHVGNLRRKIRALAEIDLIETVRGVGFRLQEPGKAEA
jgi:DNA-binding response OmpR family regulator